MLLINATPTGTEALKNLILPGIGKFTIADNQKVEPSDHGCNFFVTEDSIGKPRAEVTTELLGELNPDSAPCALPGVNAATFIKDPSKLAQYNLVIGCDLTEEEMIKLGKVCADAGKSLIVAATFGLIGYVRLYKPEHVIIDSRPTGQIEGDLRLSRPFPELIEFASKFNLETLDKIQHKHVPFPVLLIKAKELWKTSHEGKMPGTFKEKDEFSRMVRKMSRDFNDEENFQEAVAHAPQCFVSGEVKYRRKLL